MKRIEITSLINNYLMNVPLYLSDMLNTKIRFNTYEEYKEILNLVKATYKEKIPEFYNEAESYLQKVDNFINSAKEVDDDNVKQYINDNFKRTIMGVTYLNEKQINVIFNQSLTNSLDRSTQALTLIYTELGYDNLKIYIELLKNPNLLTSYLNDLQKQQIAMHYMLLKTGHHSTTKLQRNKTANNLYNEMKENIKDSINEITKEKDDYLSFIDEEKNNVQEWFDEVKDNQSKKEVEYNDFLEECKKRIDNLESTYSQKLKVEKPAEFMREKSEEYKKASRNWAIASVILIIILLFILGFIISPKLKIGKTIIEISIFNTEIPIYQSIILLTMVCLIVYILRVFIKLTISSKHLSEEYKQKYVLTYFFLSLINKGKIDNDLNNSIISKLFTKADTGLIKNDTNIEIESIYKTLTGINK